MFVSRVTSIKKIHFIPTVGKDGGVEKVRTIGDDAAVSRDLRNAVKQWRFKPFVMAGQDVTVQTIIQLKKGNADRKAIG